MFAIMLGSPLNLLGVSVKVKHLSGVFPFCNSVSIFGCITRLSKLFSFQDPASKIGDNV